MREGRDSIPITSKRLLAAGHGWSVQEEVCRAGPTDAPYEESHSHFSVSAVLAGTFTYRSARGRTLLTPGALLLGQKDAAFCCGHEHGVGDCCLATYLDSDFLDNVASNTPGASFAAFRRNRVGPYRELCPLLRDLAELSSDPSPAFAEECALRCAGAALRFTGFGSDGKASSLDERRIAAVIQHIGRSLASPLTLEGLASRIEMSKYHFLRIFHRTVGETPYRYILSQRLTAAAERLTHSRISVLEVVSDLGFGDLSEFNRHFLRTFGTTPSRYRKQWLRCPPGNRQFVPAPLSLRVRGMRG